MVDRDMLLKLDHHKQVMFAVFCARQVIDLVQAKDKEVCLKAIEAAEGFIEGRLTKEECRAAADAAYAAADATAYAAAYAAIAAADAAIAAADAAIAADAAAAAAAAAANAGLDKESTISEQTRYYDELLNFDKIVEEALGV